MLASVSRPVPVVLLNRRAITKDVWARRRFSGNSTRGDVDHSMSSFQFIQSPRLSPGSPPRAFVWVQFNRTYSAVHQYLWSFQRTLSATGDGCGLHGGFGTTDKWFLLHVAGPPGNWVLCSALLGKCKRNCCWNTFVDESINQMKIDHFKYN